LAKSKKGSKFERDTCRKLSLWFSHGKRDDIFWRTAGSGARATVRAKSGKMTADSAGDISAIDEKAKPFTAVSIWELKRGYTSKRGTYGSISILSIVDKLSKEKDPILVEWSKKLHRELKTHKRKYGFIVFQRDRKNPCIAMGAETFKELKLKNKKKYYWPPFGPICQICTRKVDLVLILFDEFLEWCEPETITRKITRRQKGFPYEQLKPLDRRRKIKRRKL